MDWLKNWIEQNRINRFEKGVSIEAAKATPGKWKVFGQRFPDLGITETLSSDNLGGRNDHAYLQNRQEISDKAINQESDVSPTLKSLQANLPTNYTTAADVRKQDIQGLAEDSGYSEEDASKILSKEGLETVIGGNDTSKAEQAVSLAEARKKWLQDTANSPAQKSGAWDSDEGREQLWQTHLDNQRWRRDKGRSYTHGDFLD